MMMTMMMWMKMKVMMLIVRAKKGGDSGRMACAEALKVLVLAETLEFIMPLGYMSCFIVAYFGPNANVLGNVKNGYWQYVETTGI